MALMKMFARPEEVSLLEEAESLAPLVGGVFVRVERGAGVGVRMAEPGEGMRGGGSSAEEDMTLARSAAAAASIRLFSSSSSFSLLSLA